MDTVTVLLHRLGVAYTAIMNPVFRVRRNPAGELLGRPPRRAIPTHRRTASTRPGSTSSCRRRRTPRPSPKPATLLPNVLADARQVALDSAALNATLVGLASHAGRRPRRATSRPTTAATSRRCCAGSPTDTSCCSATSAARSSDGQATVDPTSRLGVLRLRTDVLAAADRAGRPAGAGAGDHAELPALRRAPAHRGGPRDACPARTPPSSTGSSGCSPSPPRTRTCWRFR